MNDRLHQPTPTVTEADVERVVSRDYPADGEAVRKMIAAVDVREKPRIVLACLKTAAGSIAALRNELENAAGYWREIISAAEYPMATKRWSRFDSLPEEEIRKIYEADWRQYQAWLYRR